MVVQSVRVERRVDLDWIRIAAFGLLILYHVGMVFVPWYYHVKSTHLVPALLPFMLALNPWRLGLLFVVAGAATRFMAANATPGALTASRSLRLLPPLLFGMLVIVPPQSYWEVVARQLYAHDFVAFYTQHYLAFAKQFCSSGPCLILPTWNHLWFVAYLWIYTLIAMLLVTLFPGGVLRTESALVRGLSGVGLMVLPAMVFGTYRLALLPLFPPNNALVGDWYNHALYLSMFTLGYLIARAEPVWDLMVKQRWTALGISVAVFASYLLARWQWPPGALRGAWRFYEGTAYGLYQWSCIVAVLGFGRRWITRDSAARRYLTDAIFPYYVVHQTVIVGVAFALRDSGFTAAQEATFIISATAASCALTYEMVRRARWLRPLFGLKLQGAAT
ncbi:acyltransferase family protein [Tardiphaga sp.]|uniref:acyltransferase family protein n=1 Tax=Tardiphaga sp. TaxID=1926292 RepID=UPI00261EF76A|nr:acyltransferase family protein [Tardiphaga sp.]MDB5616917.1 acyltransferase [Tardiphaga sp.]